MTFKYAKSFAIATAVFGAASVLTAFSSSTQSVSVVARVPLLCEVNFAPATLSGQIDGRVTLGQSNEFCNSGTGYRLMASATGDVAGASLIVGGRTFELQNGQEVEIVASNGPARTARSVDYDPGNSAGGGNLTLRIEAN